MMMKKMRYVILGMAALSVTATVGRLSRRSARGTLGVGGPQLELKTVNGSIRIR